DLLGCLFLRLMRTRSFLGVKVKEVKGCVFGVWAVRKCSRLILVSVASSRFRQFGCIGSVSCDEFPLWLAASSSFNSRLEELISSEWRAAASSRHRLDGSLLRARASSGVIVSAFVVVALR